MRTARLKVEGKGYYHCMSRVVDKRMIFNNQEKERFRNLMRAVEQFSGVKILTYAVMTNHFHILLEVPEREEISDALFLQRVSSIYHRDHVLALREQLREYRKEGHDNLAEREKARYTYRMYDVSEFMKTLKQKFTQSYNKRHSRKGTLWEERFNSILVEGSQHALLTMAVYIDLNAVRAGIVRDPKNYRYCGYAEAIAGKTEGRLGLQSILHAENRTGSWIEIRKIYREQLYIAGEARGTKSGPCFSREKVEKVLSEQGDLSTYELLRCRVRYFSDGLVLGSQNYVEEIFQKYRCEFGAKRKNGARIMRGGEWGGLCTMRDLKRKPILLPN